MPNWLCDVLTFACMILTGVIGCLLGSGILPETAKGPWAGGLIILLVLCAVLLQILFADYDQQSSKNT